MKVNGEEGYRSRWAPEWKIKHLWRENRHEFPRKSKNVVPAWDRFSHLAPTPSFSHSMSSPSSPGHSLGTLSVYPLQLETLSTVAHAPPCFPERRVSLLLGNTSVALAFESWPPPVMTEPVSTPFSQNLSKPPATVVIMTLSTVKAGFASAVHSVGYHVKLVEFSLASVSPLYPVLLTPIPTLLIMSQYRMSSG